MNCRNEASYSVRIYGALVFVKSGRIGLEDDISQTIFTSIFNHCDIISL